MSPPTCRRSPTTTPPTSKPTVVAARLQAGTGSEVGRKPILTMPASTHVGGPRVTSGRVDRENRERRGIAVLKAAPPTYGRHLQRAAVIAIAAVALTQQAIAGVAALGSWTIVPSPNPPASLATLSSVSCYDATSCFAVGDAFARGTDRPLAEHWDGSAWSVTQTPALPLVGGLDLVSCPTAQWCMTVGTRTPAGGGLAQTLAAVWDGTSWSRISSPTPGQGATLTGLACVTTSDCFVVGEYSSTSGGQIALIEDWDGASWRISPSPKPPGVASALQAVSCPTVSGASR